MNWWEIDSPAGGEYILYYRLYYLKYSHELCVGVQSLNAVPSIFSPASDFKGRLRVLPYSSLTRRLALNLIQRFHFPKIKFRRSILLHVVELSTTS